MTEKAGHVVGVWEASIGLEQCPEELKAAVLKELELWELGLATTYFDTGRA